MLSVLDDAFPDVQVATIVLFLLFLATQPFSLPCVPFMHAVSADLPDLHMLHQYDFLVLSTQPFLYRVCCLCMLSVLDDAFLGVHLLRS